MDARYETFLTLCRFMNYRKTAQELHLTQPAVTRQIQSLEEEFGTKLFLYDHRKLSRTPSSGTLESYIQAARHNYNSLREDLKPGLMRTIRVGATKTIGDYLIPDAVEEYLSSGDRNIELVIDNTELLLTMLCDGRLDFALVEGNFEKERYSYRLLQNEGFTGICSSAHRFAGKKVQLPELFSESLIIREKGSGTRDIFERELAGRGYSFGAFARCIEISSFSLISRLVAGGIGVSFTYQSVVKEREDIAHFSVEGFARSHEFNTVWLKNAKLPKEGGLFLEQINRTAHSSMPQA